MLYLWLFLDYGMAVLSPRFLGESEAYCLVSGVVWILEMYKLNLMCLWLGSDWLQQSTHCISLPYPTSSCPSPQNRPQLVHFLQSCYKEARTACWHTYFLPRCSRREKQLLFYLFTRDRILIPKGSVVFKNQNILLSRSCWIIVIFY